MSDDYTIATAAAEAEVQSEIKEFVPAMFQSRIPPEAIHKMAVKVAKKVVDALGAAHAQAPPSS